MSAREPVLNPVPIEDLRPTQITVGFREVGEKRLQWREHASGEKGSEFLGRHMVPVVLGPKEKRYVIDHHHLVRALLDEGVEELLVNVIADLSRLKKTEFWIFLDNRSWCHPYDEEGRRRGFDDIPSSIAGMTDDPYRSLAGELRRAGGFAKESTAFSEFMWADFLRRRLKPKLLADDFSAALTKALKLARSDAADHLPGWCGPDPIV
ncbi:ParB-like protein [Phenylobacterium sp.]|uniref:ParB-like protein n=1 Tax=Phenylobacterium sp. TaxID=1871053 RepID=UPI002DEF3D13|nr:ParB-like protein [Phenylobacterium sp.]